MPRQIVKDVQNIRKVQKQKVRKYPVSTVYLQVVGSGAPGGARSLYVFTEHCRYLFNCGEGTQRLAYEHKIKLTMTEHVLVTYKTWENVGGLPGTLLTLQDTGVPDISIHGPPGIESLCYDTRNFMRLANLQVNYCHYKKDVFDEGPIIIKYIPIWPKTKRKQHVPLNDKCSINSEKNTDSFAHEQKDAFSQHHSSICEKSEESLACIDLAVAYICRPAPKLGALSPQKCKILGVPKGPLLGQLKNNIDVTLPCGTVVKASDVTSPADPGAVFIVLEVPTISHLESLVECPQFEEHQLQTAENKDDIAQIIVHFTPSEVSHDPRYRSWCDRFAPETVHIYINEDNSCLGSERVHKIQYKLNHLYAPSFPLLHDSSIPQLSHKSNGCDDKRIKCDSFVGSSFQSNTRVHAKSDSNHLKASTLLTYHIRPHLKIEDRSCSIRLDPETYVRECYNDPAYEFVFKTVQEKINKICSDFSMDLMQQEYPNITFLGTGSCIPNKTRNTSGIALNINACSSMILDCGEGTYGQLIRLYGLKKTAIFLQNLKVIYVSHLHADHHIGLIRLLLARKKLFSEQKISVPKLYLLAPNAIIVYLNSYHNNFQSICDTFTLVPNHKFNLTNRRDLKVDVMDTNTEETISDVVKHLNIQSLSTCLVPHCPDAYGMSLILEDGWKMTYSGDAMPSPFLETIGMGCDLLIHEATMEDELFEDAKLKRHSTTSGALDSAKAMNAKFVILTHFSQRYAKVPLIERVPSNVTVAFDNMTVRLKDLHCLPSLYPAFVTIFSQDYDEMIEKTRKRKAKDQEKANIRQDIQNQKTDIDSNNIEKDKIIKREVDASKP